MNLRNTATQYYSRIGHNSIIINNSILVFGGIDEACSYQATPIRINCDNFQIYHIRTNTQLHIEGFTLFQCNGRIFLWGGKNQIEVSSTLYEFIQQNFVIIDQFGEVPSPRCYHQSVIVANKYLIIYGGYGMRQPFFDWYMFDIENKRWYQLNPTQKLAQTVGYQMIWIAGRGIIYLGEHYQQQTAKFPEKMFYQFRIVDFKNFKLKIQQIDFEDDSLPSNRCSPLLVNMINSKILFAGGEKYLQGQKQYLDDMWTLDLQLMKWQKMQTRLNSCKYGSQGHIFKNKIILVGGAQSYKKLSKNVQYLECDGSDILQTKICLVCRIQFPINERMNQKQLLLKMDSISQRVFKFTCQVVSRFSMQIQNPLQAIGLLIHNSLKMNASLILIRLCKVETQKKYFKNNLSYLLYADDCYGFTEKDVIDFMYRFDIKKPDQIQSQQSLKRQYGVFLKMATLRLGASCLLMIRTVNKSITIVYYSISQMNNPDKQEPFNFFFYTVSENGKVSDTINRHIIRENVGHYLNIDRIEQDKLFNLYIYVLEPQQLVSYNNKQPDIRCVQEYTINSLRTYIQNLLFNTPNSCKNILIENIPIRLQSIEQKFKQAESRDFIKKKQIPRVLQNIFKRLSLYSYQNEKQVVPYILIYHKNKLIETFKTSKEKICGWIELNSDIEPVLLLNKIKSQRYQILLLKFIQQLEENQLQYSFTKRIRQ